jgi:hypothetical protein
MVLGKTPENLCNSKQKMVVIRMGDAADNVNLALSDFDNTLWKK